MVNGHRKIVGFGLPALLFLISHAIAKTVGFRMVIPWSYFQLLERGELAAHPWTSLYLLHCQPPFLNALLAAILRVSSLTSTRPDFYAECLFVLLGIATTILFSDSIQRLTKSKSTGIVAAVWLIAGPAFHVFGHLYFYPFILLFLFTWLLHTVIRLQNETSAPTRLLLEATVILGLIVNTRALFHPIWALACFGMIAWRCVHRGRSASDPSAGIAFRSWMPAIPATVLLAVLLMVWPLKNYLLFGQFTFSSWTGYNLAHGIGIEGNYFRSKDPIHRACAQIDRFKKAHLLKSYAVLDQRKKPDGEDNWNHYLFLTINPDLKARALAWYRSNPKQWLGNALANYLRWSRAPFTDPYTGVTLGTRANPCYRMYADTVRAAVYLDFAASPGPGDLTAAKAPMPLPVFGLILFPALLIASLAQAVHALRRSNGKDAFTISFMLFCLLWVLIVPCLTDGHEGNRMRFCLNPYLIALSVLVITDFYGRARQRRLQSKPGHVSTGLD